MKSVLRTIVMAATFLAIVLCLMGCERKISPVSKEQIVADISSVDRYIKNDTMCLNNFAITDRYTRVEDGEDRIIGTYSLSNEYTSFDNDFELNYRLYDDGWKLMHDSINNRTRNTVIKVDIPVEQIISDAEASGYYGVTIDSQRNGDSETERIVDLKYAESYDYLTINKVITARYKFVFDDMCWELSSPSYLISSSEQTFDINGDYEYHQDEYGQKVDYSIIIKNYNDNEKSCKILYDLYFETAPLSIFPNDPPHINEYSGEEVMYFEESSIHKGYYHGFVGKGDYGLNISVLPDGLEFVCVNNKGYDPGSVVLERK